MTIAGFRHRARLDNTLYLRGEYTVRGRASPMAPSRACRERGFLGDNILWTGVALRPLSGRRGAGAYICGEETSLMNSLEGAGRAAQQAAVGPHTSTACCQPTVLNNVYTLVTVLPS